MITELNVAELMNAMPDPIRLTIKEVDDLTYEQALEVLRMARRALVAQLLHQEYHEHMGDDCGDYLEAASSNWDRLWRSYFDNDGQEEPFIAEVRFFLREHPDNWLGCDGDVRFDIFPDTYWDHDYEPEHHAH